MTLAHPRNVCIFCGSAAGSKLYQDIARRLGEELAKSNVSVVYGGGNIGLMGVLADAVLQHDGHIIGVLPQFLIDMEVAHRGVSELIVVDSMHERKAEMAARADAFVALPGGFGTMEEFFEVLTWLQLGLHDKPCILLNVNGFYSPLLAFLQSAATDGFISEASMSLVTVCESVEQLMNLLNGLPPSSRFREDRS
jgi:uncharacterized protein (TIGR00730 family)